MHATDSVFIAGHNGLVGSALVRRLASEGFGRLITRSRRELDLQDEARVLQFFSEQRPDYVFLAAGRVGGIFANSSKPVEFLRENMLIELSVLHAAYSTGVKKLLFLGSSCIYPKFASQPITEDALLTGALEPTNEPYALAKIGGIKLCDAYNTEYGTNFVSVMPTNLYGPGDNFDAQTAHVLPALLQRFHRAKLADAPEIVVWGSGSPRREFLHVDDLADACVFAMRHFNGPGHLNIGIGTDVSIAELVEMIRTVVGYKGRVVYDRSKPDGTPRKLLDVSRASGLGWRASTSLEDGLRSTYAWYLDRDPNGA